MTTIAGLRNRVARMRERVEQLNPPQVHVFALEDGTQLSGEQLAQVQHNDRIVVRCFPAGFLQLGNDDDDH